MATITSAGLGSGLDIESIIEKLMTIERRPLNLLEQRQQTFQTQLSDYGKLKSALSTFQTAMANLSSVDKFEIYSATSSDDAVATATATSSAAPGTYAVAVTQLARAHKVASATFADGSTAIGATGTLRITVGSSSFDVAIDATNNTLNGIRTAINDAADNTGVTATVINIDDGSGGVDAKLVLTSNETGTAHAISLSDVSGTVAATLNVSTITGYAAQDAVFTLDTYTITRSSNTVTDAVDGLTLTLKSTGSATLTVEPDLDAVKANVQKFVDAYNNLRATIAELREGSLKSDNTLISIASQIRDVFNTAPTGLSTAYDSLSEVGIKTNRDGTLSLDAAVLDDALQDDFDGVAQLFANDDEGYAFRLDALVDDFLDVDGVIDSRTDGLDARIDDLADKKASYEYRLEIVENRLRKQFTALDTFVMQMQSTSSYLALQLASLPAAGK